MSSNRPSLSPLPAKSNRTLAIPRSHSLRESSVWTKLISFRVVAEAVEQDHKGYFPRPLVWHMQHPP